MQKKSARGGKPKLETAMILAAGLGLRLRPITNKIPKPLVKVANRTLLDHTIDKLLAIGVKTAIINIHYLGDQIRQHLSERTDLEIIFASEADTLLETGGGIKNVLEYFGNEPFLACNADVLWLNGPSPVLKRMQNSWHDEQMDGLLMLHSTVEAYGYTGNGDFELDSVGKLSRKLERELTPYLFTGVQILHPRIFKGTPSGAFSLNMIYDKLIKTDRLYGILNDGEWFHIGTPDGLDQAEKYMQYRYSGVRHR
ncbi:MAG: mannose-1-phosphate guanylyltransferase [Rhodospirillaceae bacterium]|nr:mannose-1-phosphate guanylyltransferase [Rhodospirillaceae bacterium]OUT76090.1 MAG: hypothetical protein CBB83_11150 [Rhodospirillaceae bacterium TMED23]|tara:strand:+ start:5416 stop:6177 length:762 start_codon:yes stop_codon:yes gene_type:complete